MTSTRTAAQKATAPHSLSTRRRVVHRYLITFSCSRPSTAREDNAEEPGPADRQQTG